MKYEVSTVFRGIDMLSPVVDKMQRKTAGFASRMEQHFNVGAVKLERLNSAIRSTAASATALTLALGLPMVSVLKTGAQFEDTLVRAFNKLDERVPYGSARFRELRSAIMDATKGTEFTANQGAAAFRELAGAGYDAAQSIGSLPTIFSLSRISQMALNDTAVRAVDLLKAFNLESKDATVNTRNLSMAANMLAAADAKSTSNMEQLLDALKNSSPAITRANGDLSTGLALIASLGSIKGEEAGTGVKQLYSRLVPTEKNKQELMNHPLLKISLKDQAGNIRDMVDVMEEMSLKLRKLTPYARMDVLKRLFGEEGIAPAKLAEVFDKDISKVRKLREELRTSGDYLKWMDSQIKQSPLYQWQQALKQLDDMKIKLSEIASGPALKSLTKMQEWLAKPETQARLSNAMERLADKLPALTDALLSTLEYLPGLIKGLIAFKSAELVMKGARGATGLWSWISGALGGLIGAGGGKAALLGAGAAAETATTAAAASATSYMSIGALVKSILTRAGGSFAPSVVMQMVPGEVANNAAKLEAIRSSWNQEPQIVSQQSRPQTSNFRFYTETPNLKAEPMPNSWEPGGLKLIQAGAF